MFNSQKINTDPNPPYVVTGYARNGKPVTWRGEARDDDHAIEQFDAAYPNCDPHTYGTIPRREFDNRPNPILVNFRKDRDFSRLELLCDCFPHEAHARKVLERIVNVYG